MCGTLPVGSTGKTTRGDSTGKVAKGGLSLVERDRRHQLAASSTGKNTSKVVKISPPQDLVS